MELLDGLTEDELTAQALAADPDEPLAPQARPFRMEDRPDGVLPDWYMPPVVAGRSRSHLIPVQRFAPVPERNA